MQITDGWMFPTTEYSVRFVPRLDGLAILCPRVNFASPDGGRIISPARFPIRPSSEVT